MPMTTIEDALAELEHCAALGLKGVLLSSFPNGMAYPQPEDDRFWAAALDMQMPLTVHVAFNRLASVRNSQRSSTRPKILRFCAKSRRGLVEQMALLGLQAGHVV